MRARSRRPPGNDTVRFEPWSLPKWRGKGCANERRVVSVFEIKNTHYRNSCLEGSVLTGRSGSRLKRIYAVSKTFRIPIRHSLGFGIASQIVRRQPRHPDASGGFLDDVPNRLYRHPISPCLSHFVDPAKQPSSINCGCGEPIVQFGSHPIGNRNRSNVTSLAHQINNGPMLFALLEMIQCQSHGFMPPQPTRE